MTCTREPEDDLGDEDERVGADDAGIEPQHHCPPRPYPSFSPQGEGVSIGMNAGKETNLELKNGSLTIKGQFNISLGPGGFQKSLFTYVSRIIPNYDFVLGLDPTD